MENAKEQSLILSKEELILTYVSLINQRDLIGETIFISLDKGEEQNIKQLEKQIITIIFLLRKLEKLLEKYDIDKNKILENNYTLLV